MEKPVIIKGVIGDSEDCVQAIMQSELGTRCFGAIDAARELVENGLSMGEIYVAKGLENEFLGFIRYAGKGMFNLFPYLHCIAVHRDVRGHGIGSVLLDFFEEKGFEKADKLFLSVSHFNSGARRLYSGRGYSEFGIIENMYKSGVHEHIMIKRLQPDEIKG